ncbi:D-tyrosyl-tRNA(Tyr) deacylase [bacterium]|nr:D-tyrosyl-tRNA(Tyr) deacylase [bacterium]
MRVVVQRVSRAAVKVEDHTVGRIDRGLLVLVGFTHGDGEVELVWMARKLSGLRIFEDEEGKMNLSLEDIHGSALVVPQFTLYANISKGRRPAFIDAAEPERADTLYNRFCELLAAEGIHIERGVFGARMDVELVNDGPVTIIAEK